MSEATVLAEDYELVTNTGLSRKQGRIAGSESV